MTPRASLLGSLIALGVAIALVVWAAKERWSVDVCLGAAALYVSIGGFAIAIAEVRRAATVTKATRDAVVQTLKGVAAGRLAITITHLRHTMEDLEQANLDSDRTGALRAINAWRNLGSEAEGPLRRRFPNDADVLPALRRSIELGQSIKAKLSEAGDQPLWPITGESLAAMEQVSNQLAALLDELTPTIQEDDEHA